MKPFVLAAMTAVLLACFTATGFSGEVKFKSCRVLAADAQTIRLKALEMGWTVNKPFSLVAASVIMGKVLIYPKSEVEVSLRESDGQLQIRAQALSKDAGTAYWHNIHAERVKKTNPPKMETLQEIDKNPV